MRGFKKGAKENTGNPSRPDGTHLTNAATVGLRKSGIQNANQALVSDLKIKLKCFKYTRLSFFYLALAFVCFQKTPNKELQQKGITMLHSHKQQMLKTNLTGLSGKRKNNWHKITKGKKKKENTACKKNLPSKKKTKTNKQKKPQKTKTKQKKTKTMHLPRVRMKKSLSWRTFKIYTPFVSLSLSLSLYIYIYIYIYIYKEASKTLRELQVLF